MSTNHPSPAGTPAGPTAAHLVADFLGINRNSHITERPVAGHPQLTSVSTAELNHDQQTMTFTSFLVDAAAGTVQPVHPSESVSSAAQRLTDS